MVCRYGGVLGTTSSGVSPRPTWWPGPPSLRGCAIEEDQRGFRGNAWDQASSPFPSRRKTFARKCQGAGSMAEGRGPGGGNRGGTGSFRE